MNYSTRLLNIFQHYELTTLLTQVVTQIVVYTYNGISIITTVSEPVKNNTYVVSPYALMIQYGEDELIKIESTLQRGFFSVLIKFFSVVLKYVKIDKVQILNNYLFSTNFFSKEWETIVLDRVKKDAITSFPDHSLVIRSVNQIQNPNLYQNLCKDGWKPIVVKQAYIYDDIQRWQKSRNTKNDKKLLQSKQFSFVESNDFERAIKLYNMLYLEKYTQHNIHYTSIFLEQLVMEGLLKLFFLQDTVSLQYVGVVGVTQENNVMTVPIIGYDRLYSQKDALYRRLVYHVTAYAFENHCLLNFSSGAPDFKTKRGAKSVLDYMFIYDKHLPLYRRMIWQSIYFVSKYLYAPMLQRLKL